MKLKSLLGVLFALCLTTKVFAEDGSSGCGPGWYILKENSMLSSTLRATTNAILWPISTLGMTFGTSNCTKHKIVQTEKESLYFVTMNYFELKNEIAMGGGEFLSGFAQTMGCPASAQSRLNSELQKNFSTVVPRGAVKPESMLLQVYKVILRDPQLTAKCSLDIA